MDVESFLINNLIDSFYQYEQIVNNMDESSIDELFVDDGSELSDRDFILSNYDQYINDEIIDSLYGIILDFGANKEIDINKVVAFLASKYYVYNYVDSPNVVSYLKSNKLDDIVGLFKDNYHFGMDLIKSFFYSMCNSKKYKDNRNLIYEKNDQDRLLDFEKENISLKIRTLNNLLRDVICNIYNHYIRYGCDDIEALNNTWMYFFQDFDPIGELDKMGFDIQTKTFYKAYLLSLMYADLYEDVCNTSIIDSENYEDRLADVIPILSVRMEAISIPAEESIRNRLLKHFILLQDDKKKMSENRNRTYKDGRIMELKKVNPFYKLDELTF